MTVSLLLLVETHLVKRINGRDTRRYGNSHLNAVVEFSNAVADVLLLLYKGIVLEILLHYMVEFS